MDLVESHNITLIGIAVIVYTTQCKAPVLNLIGNFGHFLLAVGTNVQPVVGNGMASVRTNRFEWQQWVVIPVAGELDRQCGGVMKRTLQCSKVRDG